MNTKHHLIAFSLFIMPGIYAQSDSNMKYVNGEITCDRDEQINVSKKIEVDL
jgi:hypothetical protein